MGRFYLVIQEKRFYITFIVTADRRKGLIRKPDERTDRQTDTLLPDAGGDQKGLQVIVQQPQ